jgi:hypothetical protein
MRHVRLAAVLRVARPSSFAPKVILASFTPCYLLGASPLETLSREQPPTLRNATLDLRSWTAEAALGPCEETAIAVPIKL